MSFSHIAKDFGEKIIKMIIKLYLYRFVYVGIYICKYVYAENFLHFVLWYSSFFKVKIPSGICHHEIGLFSSPERTQVASHRHT